MESPMFCKDVKFSLKIHSGKTEGRDTKWQDFDIPYKVF